MMKLTCKKCKIEKPNTEFYKLSSSPTGFQSSCKQCKANQDKKYYKKNKDIILDNKKSWRQENPDYLEVNTQWRQKNPDKCRARSAKRRATKLQATPSWLSPYQLKEIEKFYTLAKKLEKKHQETYHVDHIIPLQGDNVSGLHVPWNLQVITAIENLEKHNKVS